MTTLNELHNKVNDMMEDNKNELIECKLKIKELEETYRLAEKELAIAEKEVDPEKYTKVKEDMWVANHTKELYIKQLEKLENDSLLSKEEYEKLLTDITLAANTIHEEQNDKAAELIAELIIISRESSEVYNMANNIIKTLQYDVYKDKDALVSASGNIVTQPRKYDKQDTVHNFYYSKLQGTQLAKRAGDNPETTKHRFWG